jgi:CRP-like cAMP-binding protein
MVLSKHDYMKVLSRFEEANLREFVDFLKSLPAFCNWHTNQLTRLTYYLPK